MYSGIEISFGDSRCRLDKSHKTRSVILFHTGKEHKYEKVCNNKGLSEQTYISHTTKERIHG